MGSTMDQGGRRISGEARTREVDLHQVLAAMTTLRDGDFRIRLPIDGEGATAELALVFNQIADRNQHFAGELDRVRREVVRHGCLDERLSASSGQGSWTTTVERANMLIDALVAPTLNATRVLDAIVEGDLTQRVDLHGGRSPLRGDLRRFGSRINQMVDDLSLFAREVTRLAQEVGTEGRLGGSLRVGGLSGSWRGVIETVNTMADRLTAQVRDITSVTKAVAGGDLTRSVTVDATGELLDLKLTVNAMVGQLSTFADEVTRVAREVGTEGRLGGQAQVRGVSGVWRDLTDSVNSMAGNLTSQVRNIAQVATAVAQGDLGKKIDVDARGEILELKTTINTMVDTLSSFSCEVTRVAHEVGGEGRLGGQARVEGVHGTWKHLTKNVNELARNLTDQVRAIADVTSAVAQGDMSRQITFQTRGEVSALKDNINLMVSNLREKDWSQSNLTRLAELMQGHRGLAEVADLILRELTPLTNAQYGAFFQACTNGDGEQIVLPDGQVRRLALIAGYGMQGTVDTAREALAQGLVREAAVEKRRILVEGAPAGYVKLSSGLGESSPTSIVIIPIVFEDTLLGIIELASFSRFSDTHLAFIDQFANTIGFAINTILANTRTETLLSQSQRLATQLQERSDELQRQQIELRCSNEELAEKAALLTASSQYKSEFLAKMSHELRTPLTSMLIYARLLGDNPHKSLSEEEMAYATSIYSAGSDLLQLIDDILDLSKVEVGRLGLRSTKLPLVKLIDYVNTTFRPIADENGLDFRVEVSDDAPEEICSDEQRVEQILRNLLCNAIKFTAAGWVKLRVERVRDPVLDGVRDVIGFTVEDTGIGIPRDKLAVIFEAFEQADPASCHKYGGTGLGLSISRELAALLGGRIIAESQPGTGSAFTLYLPVLRPGQAPADAPEPEREVTEERTPTRRQILITGEDGNVRCVSDDEEPSGRRTIVPPLEDSPAERVTPRLSGKVLIVDDDMRTCAALTKLLTRSGVSTLFALNGQEGIEVLQHNPDVSLVLMDIMMPVMDGYAAISAIRRIPGYTNLPIIVLSAKTIPGEREKALAGGANEYLQKPVIDLDRLLKIACDPLDAERTEKPPTPDGDTGGRRLGGAKTVPLNCWVRAFTRRFRRRRNTR